MLIGIKWGVIHPQALLELHGLPKPICTSVFSDTSPNIYTISVNITISLLHYESGWRRRVLQEFLGSAIGLQSGYQTRSTTTSVGPLKSHLPLLPP